VPKHKPPKKFRDKSRSAGHARSGNKDDQHTHTGKSEYWIYGYHAVAAALANPERKVLRLVASPEAAAKLKEDASVPRDALARLSSVRRDELDALVGQDHVHQGIAMLTRALSRPLQDVLEPLSTKDEACVVVLDQVTDPHNVGAVLRSASAFGASAVIAPDRGAPEETGVMAKAASGALDKVAYVKAVNLVRAMELLKEHGFWINGLAADADVQLEKVALKGKIALVLGAEGEGLRRLVRETCDHVAALPMRGDMESLNVSNAAAVALYEKARQSQDN